MFNTLRAVLMWIFDRVCSGLLLYLFIMFVRSVSRHVFNMFVNVISFCMFDILNLVMAVSIAFVRAFNAIRFM